MTGAKANRPGQPLLRVCRRSLAVDDAAESRRRTASRLRNTSHDSLGIPRLSGRLQGACRISPTAEGWAVRRFPREDHGRLARVAISVRPSPDHPSEYAGDFVASIGIIDVHRTGRLLTSCQKVDRVRPSASEPKRGEHDAHHIGRTGQAKADPAIERQRLQRTIGYHVAVFSEDTPVARHHDVSIVANGKDHTHLGQRIAPARAGEKALAVMALGTTCRASSVVMTRDGADPHPRLLFREQHEGAPSPARGEGFVPRLLHRDNRLGPLSPAGEEGFRSARLAKSDEPARIGAGTSAPRTRSDRVGRRNR